MVEDFETHKNEEEAENKVLGVLYVDISIIQRNNLEQLNYICFVLLI